MVSVLTFFWYFITDTCGKPNVRIAIERHLLDSSPAVRDAAVELIGKYMIDSPEFAGNYFSKISERIAVHSLPSPRCYMVY